MNTQYSTPSDRLAAIRAELDRLAAELARLGARTEPAALGERLQAELARNGKDKDDAKFTR